MAHIYLSIVLRSKIDLKAGWYLYASTPTTCMAVRAVHIYANANGSISLAIYKHLVLPSRSTLK